MSDLHEKLERACEVLEDIGDYDALADVEDALKAFRIEEWKATEEKAKRILADDSQKGLLEIIDSQRQTFNALMKKYDALKADIETDTESKNKLRKQRDAASERALIYAAKLGELQQENAELKIRLEMEGIEG